MKRRNAILTILFTAFFAKSAFAAESVEVAVQDDKAEEVRALLNRLVEIGALEVDKDNNVRVKKSVVDQLKMQGRVEEAMASYGSICD